MEQNQFAQFLWQVLVLSFCSVVEMWRPLLYSGRVAIATCACKGDNSLSLSLSCSSLLSPFSLSPLSRIPPCECSKLHQVPRRGCWGFSHLLICSWLYLICRPDTNKFKFLPLPHTSVRPNKFLSATGSTINQNQLDRTRNPHNTDTAANFIPLFIFRAGENFILLD
jgi:hypothetical protein